METQSQKPRAWITLERTVNLGNYSSAKFSTGIAYDEDSDPEEMKALIDGDKGILAYNLCRAALAKRVAEADDSEWERLKSAAAAEEAVPPMIPVGRAG